MNVHHKVWIEKYKGPRGTTYSVRWHCPRTGRRKGRSCGTGTAGHTAAKRYKAKLTDELFRGTMRDPVDKPWQKFVDEFMEVIEAKRRPNTATRYRYTLDTFKEVASPKTVLSVTPVVIEKFIAKRLEDDVSKATVNSDLRHLRAALQKARKWYHLPSNPVDDVERVKETEKELRVLGIAEVAKLLKTCRKIKNEAHAVRWEAFVYLALTCGLRRGELLNLRWQDIDTKGRLIKLTCRDDWQTKSGKNRVVFLDEHAIHLLDQIRKIQAGQLKLTEHVFTSEEGGQWGQNLSRDFQWLVNESKLARFTLHDLRRTFCSALANANVQEAIVQKLAGHASMATTLKFYTKINLEAARKAAQAIPYRQGGEPAQQSDNTGSKPEVQKVGT